MRISTLSFFSVLVSFSAVAGVDISRDEFKMYQHYRNALADPRVQKMKETVRMAAIAKDAGFKLKDLERAVQRGEGLGDLKAACEGAIREALGATELKARIAKVDVDTQSPHAVAYVEWLNENPTASQLATEASWAAHAVMVGCPMISSIQVWAGEATNVSARVFQGLISASAAANIKPERIKDFAETRYLRLFEKVTLPTAAP